MKAALAVAWLVLVGVAAANLVIAARSGWHISSDLLALLPQEERDPVLHRIKDEESRRLGRKVILLIGDRNREQARAMAEQMRTALVSSGLASSADAPAAKQTQAGIFQVYFPYRNGLLSAADRQRLRDGRGNEIVQRALAMIYGFVGVGDASTLRADPFLLLPAFLADLPFPKSHLTLDEGVPTVTKFGKTWVLVTLHLNGEPYVLNTQQQFVSLVDKVWADVAQHHPDATLLRLGPVFFAAAASTEGLHETSIIGAASIIGMALLVLSVFWALAPLWQTILAMGVGIAAAFSVCLALFGEVHVLALLFGTSLIGTTVDYSLHYFCEAASARDQTSDENLREVLPGLVIGLLTTLIGYATLLFAPLPGLHQIAVFSGVGMIASFATVVLWLPRFGWRPKTARALPLAAAGAWVLAFWEARRFRMARAGFLLALAVLAIAGATRLSVNDDIRRMQALSPRLVAEQASVQALTGIENTLQSIIVRAPDTETALRREEMLADRLRALTRDGALGGFATVAGFVPSAARQAENARLIAEKLEKPFLAQYFARLGLLAAPEASHGTRPLTPADVTGRLPFLRDLIIDDRDGQVVHLVRLEGPVVPDRVRAAADGLDGVVFMDPAGDVSRLLAKYRARGVVLLVISTLLMVPVFFFRYGVRRGIVVILPPLAAVALTPLLMAAGGVAFSFFNAMALVLVLAMGVDYAVFSAEASADRRTVAMLAVTLATLTTLMSFGFLAFSSVPAVHAFGSTMLVGIALAFLLSPLAAARREKGAQ